MQLPDDQSIDKDGYRPNVGIILCNGGGQVLWARRSRHDGPQRRARARRKLRFLRHHRIGQVRFLFSTCMTVY